MEHLDQGAAAIGVELGVGRDVAIEDEGCGWDPFAPSSAGFLDEVGH